MEAATGSVENNGARTAEVIETAGTVFTDGSALELVSPSAGNTPRLLFWEDGKDPIIALQVERDGTIYRPPNVDCSVWLATTLPTEVVDRGPAAELFGETADLFRTYAGMSTAEGALLTAWNATTQFADVLLNLPTLFIHGPDMVAAMKIMRLLSCIARHALILTEIDRAAICWLMKIQPTLLLNQPQMPPRLRAICGASNFKGLVLPGPKGSVLNGACSKAVFIGTPRLPTNDPGIHFFLPPASTDCPPLDVATQLQIRKRFQPWYLSYRLSHLREVQQSRFAGTDLSSPMGEIAAMLQSCTRNGGQLMLEWEPLLTLQAQDDVAQRFFDPVAAATEVLWPRVHSSDESISMKDLTGFTNTLLRARGENRECSSVELGIKLKNEGVSRRRRNFGLVLLFDQPTRRRVHQMARSLGVGRRVAGCKDCEEIQIPAE
jgi:hypothetical protein